MSSALNGAHHDVFCRKECADKVSLQSGIASLLHFAQCRQPGIRANLVALAAFASDPPATHFEEMLDVVCYVRSQPQGVHRVCFVEQCTGV